MENTAKMANAILLTIGMHVGPTRFLEFKPPDAEYDSTGRQLGGHTSVDWDDDSEIKKAMAAADNNKDDDKEDP